MLTYRRCGPQIAPGPVLTGRDPLRKSIPSCFQRFIHKAKIIQMCLDKVLNPGLHALGRKVVVSEGELKQLMENGTMNKRYRRLVWFPSTSVYDGPPDAGETFSQKRSGHQVVWLHNEQSLCIFQHQLLSCLGIHMWRYDMDNVTYRARCNTRPDVRDEFES